MGGDGGWRGMVLFVVSLMILVIFAARVPSGWVWIGSGRDGMDVFSVLVKFVTLLFPFFFLLLLYTSELGWRFDLACLFSCFFFFSFWGLHLLSL